jgi:glycosyltransferase involved in cell wall biosynthesis
VGITQQEFFKTYPHLEEKKAQIDAFVEFCGRVSHTQSIKELKSADYCIFVRNSTRKNNAGFPTKFVECYTSGVGIIANNISDIKDYFPNDGYSILIEENTDENIAQAIKQALQNGKPAKTIAMLLIKKQKASERQHVLPDLSGVPKRPPAMPTMSLS